MLVNQIFNELSLPVLLNATYDGLSFIVRSRTESPSLSWVERSPACWETAKDIQSQAKVLKISMDAPLSQLFRFLPITYEF